MMVSCLATMDWGGDLQRSLSYENSFIHGQAMNYFVGAEDRAKLKLLSPAASTVIASELSAAQRRVRRMELCTGRRFHAVDLGRRDLALFIDAKAISRLAIGEVAIPAPVALAAVSKLWFGKRRVQVSLQVPQSNGLREVRCWAAAGRLVPMPASGQQRRCSCLRLEDYLADSRGCFLGEQLWRKRPLAVLLFGAILARRSPGRIAIASGGVRARLPGVQQVSRWIVWSLALAALGYSAQQRHKLVGLGESSNRLRLELEALYYNPEFRQQHDNSSNMEPR